MKGEVLGFFGALAAAFLGFFAANKKQNPAKRSRARRNSRRSVTIPISPTPTRDSDRNTPSRPDINDGAG